MIHGESLKGMENAVASASAKSRLFCSAGVNFSPKDKKNIQASKLLKID